MAFFLVSLGLTAALIGIATGIWSTDAARRKAIAAQHLTQVQQQLTESITAQQDAKTRQTQVAMLLADGVQQAHIGHFSAAEKAYDEVLGIDPRNSDALQFKGYLELRQGNVAESVRLLRMAVAIAPADPWAHYNLSLALFRSGDTTGAVEQLRELLKVAPEFRATCLSDPQFSRFRRQPEVRKLLATPAPSAK